MLFQIQLVYRYLEELDLSCTRMGPAAAIVFAESLEKNETLLKLHLRDNPLGEKGGRRWGCTSSIQL